jgi:hypothetical protein
MYLVHVQDSPRQLDDFLDIRFELLSMKVLLAIYLAALQNNHPVTGLFSTLNFLVRISWLYQICASHPISTTSTNHSLSGFWNILTAFEKRSMASWLLFRVGGRTSSLACSDGPVPLLRVKRPELLFLHSSRLLISLNSCVLTSSPASSCPIVLFQYWSRTSPSRRPDHQFWHHASRFLIRIVSLPQNERYPRKF